MMLLIESALLLIKKNAEHGLLTQGKCFDRIQHQYVIYQIESGFVPYSYSYLNSCGFVYEAMKAQTNPPRLCIPG